MREVVSVDCLMSPVGLVCFASTRRGVFRVGWGVGLNAFVRVLVREGVVVGDGATEVNDLVKRQLGEYFEGVRRVFNVPIDLRVSGFARKVLNAVASIPFGEVRSYRDVAVSVGSPKAYRAVGNAVARNPVPIIIPCHRVVKSDGSIGRYGGDENVKAWLLRHEGITLLPGRSPAPARLKIVK
ncbi:MAG: methylated-DNA--[protein]-cysteine S-methyltransferase [Candidatus Caldarchaeum sp.]